MTSSAPSFKPKLLRSTTFVAGKESADSSSAAHGEVFGEGSGAGRDSERSALANRAQSDAEAALQCSRLELQVTNSALAVVVRALRRTQQINSELRSGRTPATAGENDTIEIVASVADELTNIPPGLPAASLLPVILEQAIKETDAFNRAFYDASMSAPPRPDSPDISHFSVQSSQHSVASPHSEFSTSSPAALTSALDRRDAAPSEAVHLPPMQLYMWDHVLWPTVSAKIDAIISKSSIIEQLLDSTVETCSARPYPASSCISLPIWIDPEEHPALSSFVISHVLHPLQTLAAMAGLEIRVTGALSSAWSRAAAGCPSSASESQLESCCPFWSSYASWGTLPISFHVAAAADPATICVSVLGQRLIQPFPFTPSSLGLIRRRSFASVPTSYNEVCVLTLPPQMTIEIPRISLVISPQDDSSIGSLQRLLLHGDAARAHAQETAAVPPSDWSLQQSPLQWLSAFQLKKRILQANGKSNSKDSGHTVIPLIGHSNVVSSLQRQLIEQLFVWFPNMRQAAQSVAACSGAGIKSVILRQMYQQPFLLLSDPFAFHRSISQLQVEHLPSRAPVPTPTHWVTCKDFTGSSGLQSCDQAWCKSGRAELAKAPLLRAHPPCLGAAAVTAISPCGSWQLHTTQLLLRSLASCFGRERQLLEIVEWFKSLSISLATREVSHSAVAVVCGLKGCGKTTLLAASHRLFSNASSENFAPVEAIFLCEEVFEPLTAVPNFWSILALNIVCALADSGLAAVTITDAAAAAAGLADVARESCCKRAVAVIVDIPLSMLSVIMSTSPPPGFHLPRIPGFMIIFTTTSLLPVQSSLPLDPDSLKLQTLCALSKAPFLELPVLDARGSLALVNCELSRYYQVAGQAQAADFDSFSSSFHQFVQSVPIMGGHPLWIKAACRCACLLPDEWRSRLSEHATRISALLLTSAPQQQSDSTFDHPAKVPHPPAMPFKPNLASSLKATAERWKRDGFDLFGKSNSGGSRSAGAVAGSTTNGTQAASQDTFESRNADVDVSGDASGPSDRCVLIIQEIFDILIAVAASSLNLDLRSEFVGKHVASSAGTYCASTQPRPFVTNMLHLASMCKCPVPLHAICNAINTSSGAVACTSWIFNEVLLLNAAGCIFVLRRALLPKLPPNMSILNSCLSLSVSLGHSVAGWSAAVEKALIADEEFVRTQPCKAPRRRDHAATPTKAAGGAQPIEQLWFSHCANALECNQDSDRVLNSMCFSTFALHSLLNSLVCVRLGGLLQQWLMTPACAMVLASSEMSRLATRNLWNQSHELGAQSAAAVLLSETKRLRAAGTSLPTLLSLLTSANTCSCLLASPSPSQLHPANSERSASSVHGRKRYARATSHSRRLGIIGFLNVQRKAYESVSSPVSECCRCPSPPAPPLRAPASSWSPRCSCFPHSSLRFAALIRL